MFWSDYDAAASYPTLKLSLHFLPSSALTHGSLRWKIHIVVAKARISLTAERWRSLPGTWHRSQQHNLIMDSQLWTLLCALLLYSCRINSTWRNIVPLWSWSVWYKCFDFCFVPSISERSREASDSRPPRHAAILFYRAHFKSFILTLVLTNKS